MPERVKYPLTTEAKEAAKILVEAWSTGKLEQRVNTKSRVGVDSSMLFRGTDVDIALPTLMELGKYGLVELNRQYDVQGRAIFLECLLLQELRNAVQNDFEVSDYFLTLNAVGTIVYGNLEVKEGAMFQSAAANQGNIIQNTGQLASELEALLGGDVLAENEPLQSAIQDLRTADESSRRRKMGKVIQELGRCLEHLANTGGVLAALALLVKALGG